MSISHIRGRIHKYFFYVHISIQCIVGTHLQQYCLQLVARNIEKLVRYSLIEISVFRHINVPIF